MRAKKIAFNPAQDMTHLVESRDTLRGKAQILRTVPQFCSDNYWGQMWDPHLRVELLEVVVVVAPDHVRQLVHQRLPDTIVAPEALQVIRAQPQRDLLPPVDIHALHQRAAPVVSQKHLPGDAKKQTSRSAGAFPHEGGPHQDADRRHANLAFRRHLAEEVHRPPTQEHVSVNKVLLIVQEDILHIDHQMIEDVAQAEQNTHLCCAMMPAMPLSAASRCSSLSASPGAGLRPGRCHASKPWNVYGPAHQSVVSSMLLQRVKNG